jgi:CubicO group peptidase (beta-lactamase class C family)
MFLQNLDDLDSIVQPLLRAGRVPGAAIAVVNRDRMVFAKGYGYRDVEAKLSVTSETVYPIASTTKAMNATLIGMLVDEGKLAWDTPVQEYLPRFRVGESLISSQVTLRDLLAMRTGLPRHDWLWIEQAIDRPALVERLRYLELSAGFREKFQYNNMTASTAGHIAEIVTGRSWESLVRERILGPLGMSRTTFTLPATGNVTRSYHENSQREVVLTKRLASEVTAPSGGAVHSTVEDMARWLMFNLSGGRAPEGQLIEPKTLKELLSPHWAARTDPSCPSPNAAYAMGWYVDAYNGRNRLLHGGYLHDVSSEVSLFPDDAIGIVSFTNFGPPGLSRTINQYAFDALMGFKPVQSVEDKLAEYEKKVRETRERNAAVRRVPNTSPSHPLADYTGVYNHRGYGEIEIRRNAEELVFRRGALEVALQHWHYDAWIAKDMGIFPLHSQHAFEPASRLVFETSADGEIAALSIRLEPAVSPIRFEK